MAIDLLTIAAGTGGFVIFGQDAADYSGRSVSSAGDVNGDGFDDIIIGATDGDGPGNARDGAGESYVIFGKATGFGASIDLATIAAGTGGFVIYGEDLYDASGKSVSSAGDINGDGFDDLIIGTWNSAGPGNTRPYAGDSYVVFGKAGGFGASIDLATIASGTGGFVIHGQDGSDYSSQSVTSAGDINGDGFDDLFIDAPSGDGPGNTRDGAGDSYVVFGKAGGFGAAIDLATIAAGTGGFVIHGQEAGDGSGSSVSSAGDLNGDGFADMIIGAPGGDGPGNTRNNAGDSYVVFGKASGFGAAIDLATIAAGTGGFVIHGQDASDYSGASVSSAGDVNGDGFDDLIIGAKLADGPANTRNWAGDSYVVFGKASGFTASIDLTTIAAGTGGFVIFGQDANDVSARSVSSAGDINGDGFDDLIIGAYLADGPGNARDNAGDTYVVFGKASGFGASIDLASIAAGTGGFVIHGEEAADFSGRPVSSAGDIDGDGFDDMIIGAYGGDGPANTRLAAGNSYVIFGSATVGGSANAVTHAGTAASETLTGSAAANVMVGGRGNDTLLGSGGADVLRGGEGNDTLTIADASFRRVSGGLGNDVLGFSGPITLVDTDFRKIEGIESLKLGNSGTTILTLGTIAAAAFDEVGANAFRITIDGSAVTNALVNISGIALTRGLDVNLAADAVAVTMSGGSGNDIFVGGGGSDPLSGNAGNDTLIGGAGADSLFGDGNDDSLAGDGGADALNGGSGHDIMTGGADTDTLNGRSGMDTAAFADASGSATWRYKANGSWTVTSLTEGTDTISQTEMLRFSDRPVRLWRLEGEDLAGDFNGDNVEDVLLRNANGDIQTWELSGSGSVQTVRNLGVVGYELPFSGNPGYSVAGVGNFNAGSGSLTDDILYRQDNGNLVFWSMNGTASGAGAIPLPLEYHVHAVADFNGDNTDDLLLRNANSDALVVWQMSNFGVSGGGAVAVVTGTWRLLGTGDFDGDTKDDLLWYNSANNALSIWQMNGNAQVGGGVLGTLDATWSVQGIADFNADGRDDILWRHQSGALAQWQMNGNLVSASAVFNSLASNWQIQNVGTYDTGNAADILLRDTASGTTALWTMSGMAVAGSQVLATPSNDWWVV